MSENLLSSCLFLYSGFDFQFQKESASVLMLLDWVFMVKGKIGRVLTSGSIGWIGFLCRLFLFAEISDLERERSVHVV